MSDGYSIPLVSPRQYASLALIGLFTVLFTGIAACVCIVFGLLWLLIQFALIVIQASIETMQSIGLLYLSSDPLIKFCLLVAIGYVVYRLLTRARASQRKGL
jgi:hypothetical protein